MREILFRGKLIEKYQNAGSWIYGSLLITADRAHHIFSLLSFAFEVDASTVGQYTGLKDDNGDPIFEGDIVRDQFRNIGVVKYSDHFLDWRIHFCIGRDDLAEAKESGVRIFDWVYPKMCLKIIGNVHDMPELLKGGGL